MGAIRLSIPPALATPETEDDLFDVLAGIPASWTRTGAGLDVWVEDAHLEEARGALDGAGFRELAEAREEERDWVSQAADLWRPVVVERYLLDPHEGARATHTEGLVRVHIPATRAFGTGSHESTRLALGLLLEARVAGRSVLDVGCGAGTLAIVAAKEGAARAVAFDVDADAAFAARELSRANGVPQVACFAGPLEALSLGARFDVIVANMILEEVSPLFAGLRARCAENGRLLLSGHLSAREVWLLEALAPAGFEKVRSVAENEWIALEARPL